MSSNETVKQIQEALEKTSSSAKHHEAIWDYARSIRKTHLHFMFTLTRKVITVSDVMKQGIFSLTS